MKTVFLGASARLALAVTAAIPTITIPTSSTVQATDEKGQFSAPAGSMRDTLFAIGRAFDVNVIASEAMIARKRAAAVTGALTVEDALRQALVGTTLAVQSDREGDYLIVPRTSKASPLIMVEDEIDEIVVQGRLTDMGIGDETGFGVLGQRDILDTPYSVTAFTDELIQNALALNLPDILVRDPSINISSGPASFGDSYEIRGFEAGRQQFLYDGTPGLFGFDGFVVIGNLDRVEVFRGPNAFGTGAATFGGQGGTVNLVPKRPEGDYGDASIGVVGGAARVSGTLSRRFGADEQFGALVSVFYTDGSNGIDNSSRRNENYALYLDWIPWDDIYVSVEFSRYRNKTDGFLDDLFLPDEAVVPDAPSASTSWSQPWAFVRDGGTRIHAKFKWDITENISFDASGGQLWGDDDNGFRSAFVVINNAELQATLFPSFAENSLSNFSAFQAHLNADFELGNTKHKLSAAVNYFGLESFTFRQGGVAPIEYDNIFEPVIQDFFSFTFDNFTFTGENTTDIWTYGITYEISALDGAVNALAGLRQTDLFDNSVRGRIFDESALNPYGAVFYKPTANSTLYASYSQALQPSPPAPMGTANALENLDPTRSRQWEIGAKYDLNGLLLTAAYFQVSQELFFINENNVFVADGEQLHKGFELQAAGSVGDRFRFTGGFTILDASAQNGDLAFDGNTPVGVAEITGSVYGEYDLSIIQGLTLTAGATYFDGEFIRLANDAGSETDDAVTLDLGARYAFEAADLPITATLVVNNIAGADFWQVNAFGGLQLNAPRIVRFNLSTRF